jgi:hypothetical protein
MTEFRFLPAVNLIDAAEKTMRKMEELEKDIQLTESNLEYWQQKAVKLKRMNNILLQLTHDYESLLETLPDENSQERLNHVSNILRRMENNGIQPSTETEPQPESTQKEGPEPFPRSGERIDFREG